jgi:hypothetical membrane protein
MLMTGTAGVTVYLFHGILGGILYNGYNHLQQPISDLSAVGAPNRLLIILALIIYSVLMIGFSIALTGWSSKYLGRTVTVGAAIFLGIQILSLAYLAFPVNPGRDISSFQNIMHLVITAVIVPASVASPVVVGIGLLVSGNHVKAGIYSLATGAAVLVFGGIAVVMFSSGRPLPGLFERLNIAALLAWVIFLSTYLFSLNARKWE